MAQERTSLLAIFATFSKVGAFTIGGGYAMIPLIQNEMGRKGWISEQELPDIIALAQSAPGLLAINVAIFAGYKIRGVRGSIAATIGAALPSFLIILLIAALFAGYEDNPYVIRIFKGIRPVVISLIAVPMINMARKQCHDLLTWALAAGSLIAVAFLAISPIYILVAVIVTALVVSILKRRRTT